MRAYSVEIEHRDTDQVFSYYHGETMLHFNATLLSRLHKAMPDEFRRITMDIGEAEYDLCMKHRGIEEPKVERLRPQDLREPGYGALFEDDGSFTIVDGHHRLVRRYRGGVRVMDFWICFPEVWQACLVEYTKEGEDILAKSIAPRVDNPERIPSRVALHPAEKKK